MNLLKRNRKYSRNFIVLAMAFMLFTYASCNKKESKASIPKSATAIVHVVISTGKSLNGIELTLIKISDSGNQKVSIGFPDKNGTVKFDNLKSGKYRIITEGPLVLSGSPLKFSVSGSNTIQLTDKIQKFSGKLKLLSYNVSYGFHYNDKAKEDSFVKWVKKFNPDIVCFQELTDFTPNSFHQFAARFGMSYTAMNKIDYFPVGIASKYPINNIQKIKVDTGLGHGVIWAKVLGINIFALHLSPSSLEKRIGEIKALAGKAKLLPKTSYTLFAGDFNSFSKFNAETYGPDWSSDMHKEKPNVKQDFTVTNALLNMGYKDSYTIFHSKFKRSAPTLPAYNSGKRPKWFKGVRYDYVFLSPNLAQYCTSSNIIQDSVTDYLSDHYPCLVKFKF